MQDAYIIDTCISSNMLDIFNRPLINDRNFKKSLLRTVSFTNKHYEIDTKFFSIQSADAEIWEKIMENFAAYDTCIPRGMFYMISVR